MGELVDIQSGAPFKSEFFNTDDFGLPLIRIRDVNSGFSRTFYSGVFDEKYLVEDGDLLIGMDGEFRAIRWSNGQALLNQRVCRLLNFDEEINPSFLFQILQIELKKIQDKTSASTVKHISATQIGAIKVPLPSLSEQSHIAELLDAYDALVNDISVGLPAEIAARRKQYEHYRDKLLTFPEAAA